MECVIGHIESLKESVGVLLELLCEFSSVIEHKVGIEKSVIFLHMSKSKK